VSSLRLGVILFCFWTIFANAQQKPASSSGGTVSGRIFAITGSGDIKPARMASMYLFYMYRSVKYAEIHKEDENSAGMEWLRAQTQATEEANKAVEQDDAKNWTERLTCLKYLRIYNQAVLDTLKWAEKENKEWQVIPFEADEEGLFTIKVAHPGKYILMARGRAGFNDAAWESDEIVVAPGANVKIKMSSPKESCLLAGLE
jgi:hypothetical protein